MPARPLALLLAAGLALAAPVFAHPGHDAAPASTPGAAAAAPNAPAATLSPAAQKCVTAFLAMLNDPTRARVQAFEDEYASSERRARGSVADRVKSLSLGREQRGEVKLDKAVLAAPSVSTILVTATKDEPLAFEFQFSETEPGKLDAVMISSAKDGMASRPIDRAYTATVVEAAAKALEEQYVFPEVAAKMGALVRENLKKGAYDSITDESSLNRRLTSDFRSISKDKHLGVRLNPQRPAPTPAPGAAGRNAPMHGPADENYAFRKTEFLPGGIGYIKFDAFLEGPEAEATAAAALAFLAPSKALIFDLRENGGGSPEMIRYITSALFSQKTHLNDMVDREGKIVEEFWTFETAEGGPATRFADDLPVYVLTSARTFSGAEEFSYNLQNLKRATIIGQTTGGGAHPVQGVRLNDRTIIGVPFMRAQNPISKTNWEGTGVKPDVEVPADQALDKAIELANKALAQRESAKK